MQGKFLLMENKVEEELLFAIADFLVDSGNKVMVEHNFYDKVQYQHFIDDNPSIITIDRTDSAEMEKTKGFEEFVKGQTRIRFTNDGVFTNILPFPHRVFSFPQLNRLELLRFFKWCSSSQLFTIHQQRVAVHCPPIFFI